MKETTKYNTYRFIGKINVDEIMPWFEFDKAKPWDENEVPWVLENKVRREILLRLANLGPKTFEEIHNLINFSPNPLLSSSKKYHPKVKYQWEIEVIQNHLLNLEWYGLIKFDGKKYQVTFPVFSMDDLSLLNKYISRLATNWLKIIKDISKDLEKDNVKIDILVEKSVEKLYSNLKNDGLIPDIPNIKTLWAEQLRKTKFEDWLKKNF